MKLPADLQGLRRGFILAGGEIWVRINPTPLRPLDDPARSSINRRSRGFAFVTVNIDEEAKPELNYRKHQHILNVDRAILFQSKLPKKNWSYVVLHAVCLIKRVTTPHHKSPYHVLYDHVPNIQSFKVFGCKHDHNDPYSNIPAYRRLIRRFLYLNTTIIDITFIIQQLSQFLSNPTHIHRNVSTRTGRGIFFPINSPLQLQGFFFPDADWTSCQDTRRSISKRKILDQVKSCIWLNWLDTYETNVVLCC
ncbi:hypothetical protein MTR_8g068060 [Medicago truncatula]|uniref:Uncharacterized protein n=1 Tax=Medicago truncatula TaxID=3880 RepID=G7LII3_MEDTR|nr:hypothetical protein MTR_8g068060 [Medicago truncatula]